MSLQIAQLKVAIAADMSNLDAALRSLPARLKSAEAAAAGVSLAPGGGAAALSAQASAIGNSAAMAKLQSAQTVSAMQEQARLVARAAQDQALAVVRSAQDQARAGQITTQQAREVIRVAQDQKTAVVRSVQDQVRSAQEHEAAWRRAGQTFQSVGQGMQNVGRTMMLGVTLPLIAIGASAVKMAADFEVGQAKFRVVSGATAAQMREVSALAIKLGNDMTLPGATASTASTAMLELAKAGLSVKDSMDAARGVLQLASAGEMQAGEAAKITASALNAFHLEGKEATKVADLLAASSVAAQGEIKDMGIALQQSSAVANMAGQSIQHTVTALGMMAKAGIIGSDAGTSIRTMLLRLVNPTNEAAALLRQFGIHINDASGKMKPLPALVSEFTRALGPNAMITTAVGGSIDKMNKALEAAQHRAAAARAEMQMLPLTIAQQNARLAELRASLQNIDAPQRKMAETIADQRKKLSELTAEMQKNIADGLRQMGRETESAQGRIAETTLEVQIQERELAKLNREMRQMGGTRFSDPDAFQRKQLEVVQLTNRIRENKNNIEDWNRTIAENARQQTEGLDSAKEKQTAIDGLNKSIRENEQRLVQMGGAERQLKTIDLRADIARLTAEIGQNQAKLAQLPQAFTALAIAKQNATLITRRMTDADRNAALATLFGADAIRAANIVLVQGRAAWDAMEKATTKGGVAQQLSAAWAKTLAGQIEGLNNKIQTLMLEFGTKHIGEIKNIVTAISGVIDWFTKLPAPVQQAVLVIGALAAAAAPVLIILGTLSKGVGLLIAGFVAVKPAILAIVGVLTGPFGGAIVAITAGIALLAVAWRNNWGDIQGKFKVAKEFIHTHLSQLWEFTKKFFSPSEWLTLGGNLVNGLVNGIRNGASAAFNAVADFARGLLDTAKRALGIASPSRAFAEMGEMSVLGYVEGIRNNAGTATQAMRNLKEQLIAQMGIGEFNRQQLEASKYLSAKATVERGFALPSYNRQEPLINWGGIWDPGKVYQDPMQAARKTVERYENRGGSGGVQITQNIYGDIHKEADETRTVQKLAQTLERTLRFAS